LCHPLRIENVNVVEEPLEDSIEVTVTVSAHEKTGVEMEALTAVSVALLNIWDVVRRTRRTRAASIRPRRLKGSAWWRK
jgi:cyclic pyranopterin phosphate synthase